MQNPYTNFSTILSVLFRVVLFQSSLIACFYGGVIFDATQPSSWYITIVGLIYGTFSLAVAFSQPWQVSGATTARNYEEACTLVMNDIMARICNPLSVFRLR